MKTMLIAAVALVSVIGSPVMAQEMFQQSKLVVHPEAAQPPIQSRGPVRHSSNPRNDVYDTTGNYVGSDPDPQVRTLLLNNRGDD